MMSSASINLSIRLFGMRGKDAGMNLLPETVQIGSSVQDIWSSLQSEADPDERLATVPSEALLVLVNGSPIEYGDGWETILNEGDEVTYMIKTSGG